ncbi:MAG: hypothetical protein HC897_11905 [Thermoanaerobaculia bacterium]|nr:hypothetical protein [Thermoanaerobaculia bacterium]
MRPQHPTTVGFGFRSAGVGLVLLASLSLTSDPTTALERSAVQRPARADQPLPPGNYAVTKVSLADPVGDTLGTTTPQVDLTRLAASIVGPNVVIDLGFSSPISPPGSGASNAIDGFIDLDTDQNAATGRLPWADALTGQSTTGMGNEYYLDLLTYDAGDGAVDLVEEDGESVVGRVAVSFGQRSLQATVPIALIEDDGSINVAAAIGTLQELPTDVAPNNGSVSSVAPLPGFTIGGGRFAVEISWRDFEGDTGEAKEVVGSRDSAVVYFFNPDNWEVLIKALDGCEINDRWWIFLSASTNVEYTVKVTDKVHGTVKTYFNPLGNVPRSIVDTEAFATCP